MSKLTPLKLAGGPYTDVALEMSVYMDNGNAALRVVDAFSREPIAVATTNVDVKLFDRDMHIKDYSENEGIFDWLIENNIIVAAPELDAFNGFITARGAVLTDEDLIDELDDARIRFENM